MLYPTLTEYSASIHAANETFKDLYPLEAISNERGDLFMIPGRFAAVFKLLKTDENKFLAIKCFNQYIAERAFRYQLVHEYIKNHPRPYFVHCKYLANGIWVKSNTAEDGYYPIVIMHWIEGKRLGEYIRELVVSNDKAALLELANKFDAIGRDLLKQDFAHGNLKHDNILRLENGELVIIDYDGAFMPELAGEQATEFGDPAYQHPQRLREHFNRHIDDFPILLISTTLQALAINPDLYKIYNKGNNIIFNLPDLMDPANSTLFEELAQYPELTERLDLMLESLEQENYIVEGLYDFFGLNKEAQSVPSVHQASNLQELGQRFFQAVQDLENENKRLHIEISTLKDQLLAQEEELEKLRHKKAPINKIWWDKLPEIWKKVFIANLDFQELDPTELNNWTTWKDGFELGYEKLMGRVLSIKSDLTITDLCQEIYQLDRLYFPFSDVADLGPLRLLDNLTWLHCGGSQIKSLAPIANLHQLEELNCEVTDIESLEPLRELKKLKGLFCGKTKINSLDPIRNLQELTRVSFWNTQVSSLEPLEKLINLKSIFCANTFVESLSYIANLFQLEDLHCSNTPIKSLQAVEKLGQLKKISCWKTQIADLTPLKGLEELTEIHCSSTPIKSLSPLKDLKNLQELECSRTKITSLAALKNIKSLRLLSCGMTGVETLSPLRQLHQLSELNCAGTAITSLKPIFNLMELRRLTYIGSNIKEKEIEQFQELHTDCEVTYMSI